MFKAENIHHKIHLKYTTLKELFYKEGHVT